MTTASSAVSTTSSTVLGGALALTIALTIGGLTGRARAADPIVVQVTSIGGPAPVTASGSSLLDILEDAIESQGAFAGFDGTAFTASLAVGGVADVATVAVNAAGTSATLSFPLIGFSQTFTGSDEEDLQEQIEDFIQQDGASTYARVIDALNQRSLIAVVDGNPGSATARLGLASFRRWGLAPTWTPSITVAGDAFTDGSRLRLDLAASILERGDFDSTAASLGLSGGLAINDSIGLALSGLVVYEDIEGADMVQAGLELALPITLLGDRVREIAVDPAADADGNGAADHGARTEPGGLRLQLTPFAAAGLGGSVDLGQGASFWGLGAAASLGVDLGPVTLSGGASFTQYGGIDLDYDDYEFQTDVDQRLLTIGGLASLPLGDGLSLSAGLSWSTYLDDAAVEDWINPEVALSLGSPSFRARLGWIGTFADDVDGHAPQLGLQWGF